MEVSRKVKIELPYNSATSLLGTYPKKREAEIGKHSHTPVFIVTLFPIAKT